MTTHHCFFVAFPVILHLLIPLYDCRKKPRLLFLVLDKRHCSTETELSTRNAKGDKSKSGQTQSALLTNTHSPHLHFLHKAPIFLPQKIQEIMSFVTHQFCCTYAAEIGSMCTICSLSGM